MNVADPSPGKSYALHPVSNGGVSYWHLTAFQQPGELRLKL